MDRFASLQPPRMGLRWAVIALAAAGLLLAGCGPDASQGRKSGYYSNTAGKKSDEGGPLKQ